MESCLLDINSGKETRMTTATRIRETLRNKLNISITRRKRGPFCVITPDGMLTDHTTKKGSLNHVLASVRCMNELRWEIKWRAKSK